MRYEIRRQIGSSKRILEVGCALGGTLAILYSPGRFLVGIDNDKKKIKIAGSINRDIQFSVMDANSLGFTDDAFDTVIFSFALHEIDDYTFAISEACRVSRKVVVADMGAPRGIGGMFFRFVEGEKLRRHLARDYNSEFSKYGFVNAMSENVSANVVMKVYIKID
jgi:ubiquinone/menaquinone biosynthesis C-methylase UbiE